MWAVMPVKEIHYFWIWKQREFLGQAASSKHNYIDSIGMNSLDTIFSIDKSFVGWAFQFPKAAAMFKYCPVFKICGENLDLSNLGSNEFELGPLNPLPDGSTWKELVGFNPKS